MTTSAAPASLSITGNPALDGIILKGIAMAATYGATWAMTHLKLTDPAFSTYLTETITGALVMLATVVYGYFNSKAHQAIDVTAGINLALSPNLLTDNAGKPVPVSTVTAAQIVKDFSPSTVKS